MNSYILAWKCNRKCTQLELRRDLILQLSATATSSVTRLGRVRLPTSPRPARLHGRHFPEKMSSKGKCAVCLDQMESRPHDSRIRCQECEVHLSCETWEHSNKSCFAVFHTIEHFCTVRKRTTFKHSQRQSPLEKGQGWMKSDKDDFVYPPLFK